MLATSMSLMLMTILRMSQIWNRRLHRLQTCPLCLHRLQTRPLHDRSEQVLQPPHRAGQGRTSPLLQLRELPPRGRERQLPRQPQIRPLCLHCLQNRLLHDQSVHVLQPQIRLLRLRCLQSRLLHDQSVQVLRPPRLTGHGRLSPRLQLRQLPPSPRGRERQLPRQTQLLKRGRERQQLSQLCKLQLLKLNHLLLKNARGETESPEMRES